MPSKTTSAPPPQPSANDFDDYLLDGDLSDNPFASPPPPGGNGGNKRKEPSGGGGGGLGIDEEVEVKKRVTVPRVKLDEARLLSASGIPKLRSRAKHLKLKGKGHEWSDASRLLSFYQIWLDDLFPKAKFLDALAMVEKAGHKGGMVKARMGWIDEGKPRDDRGFGAEDRDNDDDAFGGDGDEDGRQGEKEKRIAPIFQQAKNAGAGKAGSRPSTPDGEDLFGDLEGEEDIYGATPRRKAAAAAASAAQDGGEPDEDDLDALMAEAESSSALPARSIFGGGGSGKEPASSLFGGPVAKKVTAGTDEPDEDDLDALLAEAEGGSIFGNGSGQDQGKGKEPVMEEGEDDLDALMAEVEASGTAPKPAAKADAAKPTDGDKAKESLDDEEAMAEMEGLW